MSAKSAKYIVISSRTEYVLIKDVGPWNEFLTVTNAAELVIQELWVEGHLHFHPRLFYVDSDQVVDELRYSFDDGFPRFTGYHCIREGDTIGRMAQQEFRNLEGS